MKRVRPPAGICDVGQWYGLQPFGAMWDSGTASSRSGRCGAVRRVGRERHPGDACVAPTVDGWDGGGALSPVVGVK